MRNVLLYAKDFGALIAHHTEDPHLTEGSVMNAGEVATRLGLPGVHKAAETIVLERDVRLVEITGGRYHAATLSCAESLAVIRAAKARKLPVTCGVSVNHLTLNENDIGSYRTFLRLRPPLRAEDDRRAMVRGLAAGDIDVIVSSHDPQDADVKRHPFAEAADGAIGLETLLAAALRLYHNGEIGLMPLLRAMTINPAQAARPALRPAREGRARRPDPRRSRPALGGGQGAAADRAPRTRPSTRARCRAACSPPWLPATPSTNTLLPTAADARPQPSSAADGPSASPPTRRWRCLPAICSAPFPSACC